MKIAYRIVMAALIIAVCFWFVRYPVTTGTEQALSVIEDPVRGRFEQHAGGIAREHLSERRQFIYDAMYASMTGCVTAVSIPVAGYTSSDIEAALFSLLYDCPQFFWVDFTDCSYAIDERGVTINLTYYYSGEQLAEMQRKFDGAVSRIVSAAETKGFSNEYDKAVFIHDYIAQICDYEKSPSGFDAHTAYGALVGGSAVCDGYAHAYQYVLQKSGIECHYVPGEARGPDGVEGHAWNILKLDEKYTAVDLTWNDMDGYLFSDFGAGGDVTGHTFFGLSDAQLQKTHRADGNFLYPLPKAIEISWFDVNKLSGVTIEVIAENAAAVLLSNIDKSVPYVEIQLTDKTMFLEFMEEYKGDIIDTANAALRRDESDMRFLNEMNCFVTSADRGCILILGTLGFVEEPTE